MKKPLFLLAGLLCLGVSSQSASRAADLGTLAAPTGLRLCAPDDPLVAFETRVAASLDAALLSCFNSEKMVDVQGAGAPVPFESAFTLRLAGDGRATADLDKLLAKVTAQWKDFPPLGEELHEAYVARLNALAKDAGLTSPAVAAVKPVLVSIDRLDAKSYTAVSIRSYVFNQGGGQVRIVKVNGDAIVLRDGVFVRLTMQRMLTDASDVAQLQTEIAAWARAVEGAGPR